MSADYSAGICLVLGRDTSQVELSVSCSGRASLWPHRWSQGCPLAGQGLYWGHRGSCGHPLLHFPLPKCCWTGSGEVPEVLLTLADTAVHGKGKRRREKGSCETWGRGKAGPRGRTRGRGGNHGTRWHSWSLWGTVRNRGRVSRHLMVPYSQTWLVGLDADVALNGLVTRDTPRTRSNQEYPEGQHWL